MDSPTPKVQCAAPAGRSAPTANLASAPRGEARPFEHKGQCSTRELASVNTQCVNLNQRLEFSVRGVKMGRLMIVEEHSDHDPKKTADFRHETTVSQPSLAR